MTAATVLASALLLAPAPAGANLLVNGDFEADPVDTGWTVADGTLTTHPGIAPGSTQAAKLVQGTRIMQNVGDFVPEWEVDLYLAAATTTNSAGDRIFNMHIRSDPGTPVNAMNFRIDPNGDVFVFTNVPSNTWVEVTELSGVFQFSQDTNGDGTFDVLNMHRLNFKGEGLMGDNTYTISMSDANSEVLTHVAADLSVWHGGAGLDQTGPNQLHFLTGTGTNMPGGVYVLDSVTFIPEPASVGLLGLGGLALIRRRCAV